MTEEQDPKMSAAYLGLGAEEPPRMLDEAILAASRRPLAKPWSRRWAVPLSLAAVLVLSVTVTLRIQHEQPGIESPAPVAREAVKEKTQQTVSAPVPEEKSSPKAQPQSTPAPRKEPVPFQPARDQATVAAASASVEMRAPQAARMRAAAESADSMVAKSLADSPERELERIAGLRRDAKHDEADKALAELRKRYPDYRIPDPMLERVERR